MYDMDFWEVRRIIKGYRRRDWLKLQMIAECAYAAMYAMRDPNGKTAADIFPYLFKDEKGQRFPVLTEEEADELRMLIQDTNKANGQEDIVGA